MGTSLLTPLGLAGVCLTHASVAAVPQQGRAEGTRLEFVYQMLPWQPDLRNLMVTASLLLPRQQVFPCSHIQSGVMFQFVTSGSVWPNLPVIWVQCHCGWHQTANGFHVHRHEALSLRGVPQHRALPLFNRG